MGEKSADYIAEMIAKAAKKEKTKFLCFGEWNVIPARGRKWKIYIPGEGDEEMLWVASFKERTEFEVVKKKLEQKGFELIDADIFES